MTRNATPTRESAAFGAIVRRMRLQSQMTLDEVARAAGLSISYVGVLERGRNVPTLTVMLNVIHALGGDPVEVMRELVRPRK